MENKILAAEGRQVIRNQILYERHVDAEIEERIAKYRERMAAMFSAAQKTDRPRSIVAEGDSWFRYIVGKALIYHIDVRPRNEVLNLASPGDEVRDMMTPKQLNRLKRVLKSGPTRGRKFDAFLFSGGGNDLLGDGRFRLWLNDYESGMTAHDVVNQSTLQKMLQYLEDRYEEIISVRDEQSPRTPMYLHSYDFAQPTGTPVCGRGPWLKPGLDSRKVPLKLQPDVVAEFLKFFSNMLTRIAKRNDNVTHVLTQGTLSPEEWANEIHPTSAGFKKIASRIAKMLEADVP